MKSTKILNLLIAGIALIGGILFIRIFMEDTVAIETDAAIQNSVISPLIYFSTWLLIATVVVAATASAKKGAAPAAVVVLRHSRHDISVGASCGCSMWWAAGCHACD